MQNTDSINLNRLESIKKKAFHFHQDPNAVNTSDLSYLITLLRSDHKQYVYELSDTIRHHFMGDTIYVRGIIEFSNYCRRGCRYCGINRHNQQIVRYRISDEEILRTCKQIENQGITTVVLQSGEDTYYTRERMGNLLKTIRSETDLAITLSVGERSEATYRYWKKCGMDRFLMRFETSDKALFKALHPDDDFDRRVESIRTLKRLGVQTGSGFMIGLPETSDEHIIRDILFCRKLDLDMIGVGPFIPHQNTPLHNAEGLNDIDFLSGIISLLRIANPDAHIPATTAFDALDSQQGRQLVLKRGANVFMPNCTPQKYRSFYLLYPNKPDVDKSGKDSGILVEKRIKDLGREIGLGPGHSIHQSIYTHHTES